MSGNNNYMQNTGGVGATPQSAMGETATA